MRRYLLIAAALFGLLSPDAKAANSTVSAMTAASALGGTELLYVVQGAADRKGTPAQFATYVYGLASGDCTISGVGAVVCTKTNGVAFTAAATTAIGTSGATIPLLSTANTWTLGQTFSAAPTFGSITGSTQCLHVNTSGVLSGTGSDCGAGGGSGTVTSVATGCGTTGGPITATGTISATTTVRTNSTTSDPIVAADCGNVVYENNASAIAVSIAQAGTTGFAAGTFFQVCNINAGTVTITPTTSTIGGASTKTIAAGTAINPACLAFQSDGTNYNLVALPSPAGLFTTTGALKGNGSGTVSQAACGDLSNGGTACPAATGTSGHTLPFLDGSNVWTGAQTFGEVIGTVSSQSGTTYTFAATDCGTTVRFTNASAVTATIPQGLPVGCVIAVEQAAAGAVSVNGSAVTPATLHSAHSYTKTSAQWAVIGIFTESSNVAILTGDGA